MSGKIRILSYNIHKGFSFGNREFVLSEIKESIRSVSADLVLLQEVQGAHEGKAKEVENWPTESQFEFLSDEIWPHYAYGKNAAYPAGHHGNAILSKYPILNWENIDISTNSFEHRGMIHTTVEVPSMSAPLHCLCLHLSLFQGERRKQITQIVERITSVVPPHEPLILGGDFNDWRCKVSDELALKLDLKETHRTLHGEYARSFSALFPFFRLDRLYTRGLTVTAAEALSGSQWRRLSDHLPLLSELSW